MEWSHSFEQDDHFTIYLVIDNDILAIRAIEALWGTDWNVYNKPQAGLTTHVPKWIPIERDALATFEILVVPFQVSFTEVANANHCGSHTY